MKTPIQTIKERLFDVSIKTNPITLSEIDELIEKEKQVIVDAYFKGANDFADMPVDNDYAKEYYNETFKL